jgi:hypothetical protein
MLPEDAAVVTGCNLHKWSMNMYMVAGKPKMSALCSQAALSVDLHIPNWEGENQPTSNVTGMMCVLRIQAVKDII